DVFKGASKVMARQTICRSPTRFSIPSSWRTITSAPPKVAPEIVKTSANGVLEWANVVRLTNVPSAGAVAVTSDKWGLIGATKVAPGASYADVSLWYALTPGDQITPSAMICGDRIPGTKIPVELAPQQDAPYLGP